MKPQWWIANAGLEDRRGRKGREATIAATFVNDMLAGNKFFSESWFGGAQVQAPGSPRSFESPDTLPENVSKASGGQQAAQFEYRYILARPNGDGLGAELKKVVDEVRQLNLKHLPQRERADIIDMAENGPREVALDIS